MLNALSIKAAAFSNENWNTYWFSNGPQILIDGWKQAHPKLPLSRVAKVCSVDFLSTFVSESKVSARGEQVSEIDIQMLTCSLEDKSNDAVVEGSTQLEVEESNVTQALEELHISNQDICSSETVQACGIPNGIEIDTQSASSDDKTPDEDVIKDTEEVGDEDITLLWGDHYNSYYWYCYQTYQQEQLLATASGEEVGIK